VVVETVEAVGVAAEAEEDCAEEGTGGGATLRRCGKGKRGGVRA